MKVKRKGFTFFEISLNMVIIAITYLTFLTILGPTTQLRVNSLDMIEVATHQTSVIEQLRIKAREGELLTSYPETDFSTLGITTNVSTEKTNSEGMVVYEVLIKSKKVKSGYRTEIRTFITDVNKYEES